MKNELNSAANFLVHLIRLGRRSIGEGQLDKFRHAVIETLRRRYRDHWFPEKPFKGSGYRCIRINGKMDHVVAQAAESCGLSAALIHSTFPSELTMWVDPQEVSYRIGENGSICVLYEYKETVTVGPWQPTSTASSTTSTSSTTTTSGNKMDNAQNKQQQESSISQPSSPSHVRTGGNNGYVMKKNNLNHTLNNSSTAVLLQNKNQKSSPMTDCKESLYKIDCLLDPRKSVSIEQLAAYVSS